MLHYKISMMLQFKEKTFLIAKHASLHYKTCFITLQNMYHRMKELEDDAIRAWAVIKKAQEVLFHYKTCCITHIKTCCIAKHVALQNMLHY